jgi:GDSL-like Lipase/Acylhydrolase family
MTGMSAVCGKTGCGMTVGDVGVQCDRCNKWWHLQCDGMSDAVYAYLSEREKQVRTWVCMKCVGNEREEWTDVVKKSKTVATENRVTGKSPSGVNASVNARVGGKSPGTVKQSSVSARHSTGVSGSGSVQKGVNDANRRVSGRIAAVRDVKGSAALGVSGARKGVAGGSNSAQRVNGASVNGMPWCASGKSADKSGRLSEKNECGSGVARPKSSSMTGMNASGVSVPGTSGENGVKVSDPIVSGANESGVGMSRASEACVNGSGVTGKSKRKCLVLASSMGRGLGEYVSERVNGTVVHVYPGATAASMLNRVNEMREDEDVSAVVIKVGTNDMRKNGAESVEQLGEVVKCVNVKFKNASVAVCGVIVRRDMSWKSVYERNDLIEKMAVRLGATFVDSNAWVNEGMLAKDGLHLNERGKRVLGSLIGRVLLRMKSRAPTVSGNGALLSGVNVT